MAFITEDTLQAFSYAGPDFYAPQIFREKIFASTSIAASFCLDDYLLFLANDFLILFPTYFLRFNEDDSISFLTDKYIQQHRKEIFGVPLHLVSDFAAEDSKPLIRTNITRRFPKVSPEEVRLIEDSLREIHEAGHVGEVLGCVKLEIDGVLYHLSTKETEKYNQYFYQTPDYIHTLNHFNCYINEYHHELLALVKEGIPYPIRHLRLVRNERREAFQRKQAHLLHQIQTVEDELTKERFSIDPLRLQERRHLTQRKKQLLTDLQELKEQHIYL